MDPSACLEEIRSIIAEDRRVQTTDLAPEQVARLVELFQSLDYWIMGGGFMPEQWSNDTSVPDQDSDWSTE